MTRRLLAALVVGAFASIACGSSNDPGPGAGAIGGVCKHDADCPYHRCATNGYPGGMCTMSCNHDADCPAGTACVDDSGGICAVLCGDCSSFGPGWVCRDRSRKGAPGSVAVCHGA